MHDTSKLKLHAAQHFPLVSKFVIASKYTNEPHHQQQRNRNLAGKCREKMQFFMTKNEKKEHVMPSSRFLMISNVANTKNNSSDSYRWAKFIYNIIYYIYNKRRREAKNIVRVLFTRLQFIFFMFVRCFFMVITNTQRWQKSHSLNSWP